MSINIIELIKKQLADRDSLPVLNPDSLNIQEEITKDGIDFNRIVSLVRKDITLTSLVLKTANSPFYKGLGKIDSLKEAAVRLGQDEMGNIVMKHVHKKNFQSNHPLIKKYQNDLWMHSVVCAYACDWIVKHLDLRALTHRAFVSGLLHDIGKLYLLTALEKIFKSEGSFKLSDYLVDQILEKLHSSLGYSLLKKWNLPESYRLIAKNHHLEKINPNDVMLNIVRVADMVCHKVLDAEPEAIFLNVASSREADLLGLSEINLAQLELAIEDSKVIV